MARDSRYFRLGAFILAGTGLIVAAVVLLGAGALFKKTIPAESYFNESVQGLDVGAPVKYRGVQVGKVTSIGFVPVKYPDAAGESSRYVLVEMQFDEKIGRGMSLSAELQEVNRLITAGLRIRLTSQGLTGVNFLEMNFFDPAQNKPLPITWTPKDLRVPSAPSTMSRVEAAVNDISQAMKSFRKVDVQKLAESLEDLFATLDQTLEQARVKSLGELLAQNLELMKQSLSRVRDLLVSPKLDGMLEHLASATASADTMMAAVKPDAVAAVRQMRNATASLAVSSGAVEKMLADPALKQGLDEVPKTLANLGETAAGVRKSAVKLERLLTSLNQLVAGQRVNVDAVMFEARELLQNLNQLVDDAKQDPSRLFFGAPPEPVSPEAK